MDPDYQAVHDFLIARRLVLPFEETVPKWTNLIIENMIPVEIEETPDEEIDWSAYDWQELMKWTVSKDQIKSLRRLGPKQFVFPPEEIIPRPYTPLLYLSDEFVLSRSALEAGIQSHDDSEPFDHRKSFRSLARNIIGGKNGYIKVKDDEAMDELEQIPDIYLALGLKLEATKAGIGFTKAFRKNLQAIKEEDTAVIFSNSSSGYQLEPVVLPASPRIASPIIFARDNTAPATFPDFVELVTDVFKIPDQVEHQDLSSPRGVGMSMTAWNTIERQPPFPFLDLEAEPSPRPVWSSPCARSSPPTEPVIELEIPIFPRIKSENIEQLFSLPPPMSDFPDQENDELEEDLSQMMNPKALLSHERLWSRMNQIIAPKDIGELLIDARIEVPILSPRLTSPTPFPSTLAEFANDSGSCWSLKKPTGLKTLTIESNWSIRRVGCNSMDDEIIGSLREDEERFESAKSTMDSFQKDLEGFSLVDDLPPIGARITFGWEEEEEEEEEEIQARVDLVEQSNDERNGTTDTMIAEDSEESISKLESAVQVKSPSQVDSYDSPSQFPSLVHLEDETLASPPQSCLQMALFQDPNSSPAGTFIHIPEIECVESNIDPDYIASAGLVDTVSSSDDEELLEEEEMVETMELDSASNSTVPFNFKQGEKIQIQEVEFEQEIEVKPWKGSADLAHFLSTRSTYRLRPKPATVTKAKSSISPSKPQPLTIARPLTPPLPVLPFPTLSFLSNSIMISIDPITVVVSSDLLQKPILYSALELQNLILLDRPNQISALLNIDGVHVVKYSQLNRISNLTVQQELMKELIELSIQFEEILVIFVEVDAEGTVRPYPFTPPIVTGLESLKKSLEEIKMKVKVGFAKSSREAVKMTRSYVEYIRNKLGGDEDPLWDERRWLSSDFTEDEKFLLQLKELNSISACFILQVCDVNSFLNMSSEERQVTFGSIFGIRRVDQISAIIDSLRTQNEQMAATIPFSSSPIFKELSDTMEEFVDWDGGD